MSEYEKRKKLRKTKEFLQSKVGAMDKFLSNTSNVDKEIYEKVQDEKDINEEGEKEVSQSCLCKKKFLKSYIRSTMSQERFNGLAILSIEKHMLEQIDFNSLIIDFLSKNICRINLQ